MVYLLRYLENPSQNFFHTRREALNFPPFLLGKGVHDCFQTRRSPLTPLKKGGKETLKPSLTPLVKGRKETLKPSLTPLVKGRKETLKAPLKKGGWGDLQRLRCFKKGLKTHPSGLGHFPHNVRG